MSPNEERHQIGEVSKESGLSIDTIRYYEKIGLLEKPVRSEGGFRLYGRQAVEKLKFIQKAQDFGLTLSEIKQIIHQSERGLKSCCSYVGELLQKKLGELETKMRELQETRRDLKNLVKRWIPLRKAKTRDFTVCPQIESGHSSRKRGKRNGKKKS